MSNQNYTEEQINWAIEKLRKKTVQNVTRDQAIKLLDTFKEFGDIVTGKIVKDKKCGKIKEKPNSKQLN